MIQKELQCGILILLIGLLTSCQSNPSTTKYLTVLKEKKHLIDQETDGFTTEAVGDSELDWDRIGEAKEIYNLGQIKILKKQNAEGLQKITADLSGPNERLISNYYFDKEELFLTVKTKLNYNAAIFQEAYDPSKTDSIVSDYYFKMKKLLLNSDDGVKQDTQIVQGIHNDALIYKEHHEVPN